ncbi:DUF2202 domain-containing protein [Petroclostridium sp. X23]|uniref:ferritin-like domain-containing protein n=1 Tax=Petroclostridium sp. X23 TaxID=3045146 RepID=UPI0024ADA624|nr:DUF2202 domain-containing protein [Petroclostridium sp. X23]WHH61309.1 DUF2202 domain-containing protein [Petroclostridium sp. X23]
MKKSLVAFVTISLLGIMIFGTTVLAAGEDFGARGASLQESYSLEEMLKYAVQDEYLARSEYQKIMDTFGTQRPFSNIIKSEEQHISLLKPLFEVYDIELPEDTANDYVIIPASINEALETGVQAEIANIAMYEKFLKQELPVDVRSVFERLKNASENHLRAFKNGVDREDGSRGNNQGQGKWRQGRIQSGG